MRVLHVVNRVVVVSGHSQVHVEHVFGVGLARQKEEAHRVFAGPLDQITQRHVAAGTLGDFDLFAVLHHPNHGVQYVVGVARGYTHARSLQACAYPGDGAVVVGALDVDSAGIAALPFGQVVGHVGHEVGVLRGGLAAVGSVRGRLSHHPVFVVAVIRAFEPQRAVLLIGFTRFDQQVYGFVYAPAGVQAALQVVVVKLHLKGF